MIYYNEIDRYCCEWLRNLIAAGFLPSGDVDDRDIRDVQPDDLRGYTQCHFFAGIAGWPLALRLAGWPDDRPVWTGSCPCQPFSAAGKQQGTSDDRHLWPEFRRLIAECNPPIVFGEQVASRLGRDWLSAVRIDLEALGYAVGAADLCAAGVGAPHIRQRLWFVADVNTTRCSEQRSGGIFDGEWAAQRHDADGCGSSSSLADSHAPRCGQGRAREASDGRDAPRLEPTGLRTDGPWSNLLWLPCTDGKQRPTGKLVYPEGEQVGLPGCAWEPREANGQRTVESVIQPLAYGVPARVAKLRAAGNAIVPQVAAEFIIASM